MIGFFFLENKIINNNWWYKYFDEDMVMINLLFLFFGIWFVVWNVDYIIIFFVVNCDIDFFKGKKSWRKRFFFYCLKSMRFLLLLIFI